MSVYIEVPCIECGKLMMLPEHNGKLNRKTCGDACLLALSSRIHRKFYVEHKEELLAAFKKTREKVPVLR